MDAKKFFELDFGACLFPLKTNLILIRCHDKELQQYITQILSSDPKFVGDNFLPQIRVHAAKPRNHLRRTVLLDPVASYFIYDLVGRNARQFGRNVKTARRSFGYSLTKKTFYPVHKAYREFSETVDAYRLAHDHSISFDVASYFNSMYHHDATHWFASLPGISVADANAFGRFFREINSGRSIDFLPQGIYPTKMIGNEFLRFVDNSAEVKCAQLLRFMDDIYLFDASETTVTQDFLRIQELLGLKGLNVNPTKTLVDFGGQSIQQRASAIQEEIELIVEGPVQRPTYLGSGGGDDGYDEYDDDDHGDDDDGEESMDAGRVARLHSLLADPSADESDVEMILGILLKNTSDITHHIPRLLGKFPNIVKQIYKVVGKIPDKQDLVREITALLKSGIPLIEYQLFWIAVIAEDHLASESGFGDLIHALYERSAEHEIARAKILEIPDQTFGLKELRDEALKTGASSWASWASAIGSRTLKKSERNHVLQYFSKGSPLNRLIATCVQQHP